LLTHRGHVALHLFSWPLVGFARCASEGEEQAALYNMACAYAALQQRDSALACLEGAFEAGLADFSAVQSDSDLVPIRGPELDKLLAKCASDAAGPCMHILVIAVAAWVCSRSVIFAVHAGMTAGWQRCSRNAKMTREGHGLAGEI
jgi:hypothetical protein